MAHEIIELKDAILGNPPWYHETGAEEFQLAGGHLLVRHSPWGNSPDSDSESGTNVELVTPAFFSLGGEGHNMMIS